MKTIHFLKSVHLNSGGYHWFHFCDDESSNFYGTDITAEKEEVTCKKCLEKLNFKIP